MIPAGVGLLALVLYTRLMSAEQYGIYALVIAAVGFINAVFFQWLSLSVARLLPSKESQAQELLSTVMVVFLALVVVTGLLGAVTAWLWPAGELRGLVAITIVVGWSQAWYDLNLKLTNVRLVPVRYGILSSVQSIVAVSIGIILFYQGLGVPGILAGLIAGLLLSSLFTLKYWRGCAPRLYNKSLLMDVAAYGAPLVLTVILTIIVDVSDRFILEWSLNAKAVGIYAAAYDLIQRSIGVLMGVIYLASFPLAVRSLEDKGVAEARKQLRKNASLLLSVSVPAVVGVMMLADNITNVVFGADFRGEAGELVPWVALAIFFGAFKAFYLDCGFYLGHKTNKLVWPMALAATINLVLNFMLIPVYGMLGAAYATVCAFAIGAIASWFFGLKVFPLPLPGNMHKVVIASVGMALILWSTLSWQGLGLLVAQIAIGGFSYLFILLAIGFNPASSRRLSDLLASRLSR